MKHCMTWRSALLTVVGLGLALAVHGADLGQAIVVGDAVALRAAPRDSAQQQTLLWQGEMLEVRGERLDHVQVWDHQRERGGYVRASQLRRFKLSAEEAPELLALLRFTRESAGAEALVIGLAAAYVKAAPAQALQGKDGIEALDALGRAADRLARRASSGAALSKNAEAALSAHLDLAARYGLRFNSFEVNGRMQICYDGEAFRRVLAMPAEATQKAQAALALTRPECQDPKLRAPERMQMDEWRAAVLTHADPAVVPAYLANRLRLRSASLWSGIAYQRARAAQHADADFAAASLPSAQAGAAKAAQRALADLAGIVKTELTDEDMAVYDDAAMRVNASRWAAAWAPDASHTDAASGADRPTLIATPGQSGETCIALIDRKNGPDKPLARRCTYSLVWLASATLNREGNALALAVQPMPAWRELWVFRKETQGWSINVLPPASASPELGYAEFAGWAPGGTQLLVARESRSEGKYRRSYELLRMTDLGIERQAGEASMLGAFQRWQDPAWKRDSVSLR